MAEDHLEEIRRRAHAIWVAQGCPEGCAEAHWHQASTEILGRSARAPRKKAAAAAATATTKHRKVSAKELPLA